MKIFISPTGEVNAVYSDTIPVGKLGTADINRASNVDFNKDKQVWEAECSKTGVILCSGTNREQVLVQERKVIEEQFETDIRNG